MKIYNTVLNNYDSTNNDVLIESEKELENKFISLLEKQGYEYLTINNQNELRQNFRSQIQKLNNYIFLNNQDFEKFYTSEIDLSSENSIDKAKRIRENTNFRFVDSNGQLIFLKLFDKENIQNNKFQVINQFIDQENNYRYDVTILINGIPLIQIELKKPFINLKEAFNQLNKYTKKSFNGLFDFVQMGIISNGNETKYFSCISSNKGINASLNNFKFTSYWTDSLNHQILNLFDFTKTFLDRQTLFNIIFDYSILDVSNNLKIMRPYQIAATEAILNTVNKNHENKIWGCKDSGGYIWHTTGSGKTLTSFKTATLLKKLDFIKKIIFVVDRKDLDQQTIDEFNKFEPNSVVRNLNSNELLKRLNSDDSYKIVVTTIQKLSNVLKNNLDNIEILDEEVVFVFDECHRSQFGSMHKLITKNFKKYYFFGFTGTPIFAINAKKKQKDVSTFTKRNEESYYLTTEDLFGRKLHTYNIVQAIDDKNVLGFNIQYLNTIKDNNADLRKTARDIDDTELLLDDRRITNNSKLILKEFNKLTHRNLEGSLKNKVKQGFNAMIAVDSIDMAKAYYQKLNEIIQQENLNLFVSTIFTANPNGSDNSFEDEEDLDESIKLLNKPDLDFLGHVINDFYKKLNNISYTDSSISIKDVNKFYGDLTSAIKNNKLDIVIVVDMLLTGFDAKTLNTLFVDKELKYQKLIQAFSRTNRIYNDVKDYGNIVCFRNLKQNVDDAISLYGDNDASSIIKARTMEEYLNGYYQEINYCKGYFELREEIFKWLEFLHNEPELDNSSRKEYIDLVNKLLKAKNTLELFVDFDINKQEYRITEKQIMDIVDYYNLIKKQIVKETKENTKVNSDVTFETDLILKETIDANYILNIIFKNRSLDKTKLMNLIFEKFGNNNSEKFLVDLINQFIEKYNITESNQEEFVNDFSDFYKLDMNIKLKKICDEEELYFDKTTEFINYCLENLEFKKYGSMIDDLKIDDSYSFFDNSDDDQIYKDKLEDFYNKYIELSSIISNLS